MAKRAANQDVLAISPASRDQVKGLLALPAELRIKIYDLVLWQPTRIYPEPFWHHRVQLIFGHQDKGRLVEGVIEATERSLNAIEDLRVIADLGIGTTWI
ncbi:hypothetical protein VTJ49DRAFT_4620 [Mycothermus thermophilus]|uniref:Uncharacterized protein n=1 Tax=Humicola insolens TaxID=85995 RepID=A0ABR3V4X7_HUMIN